MRRPRVWSNWRGIGGIFQTTDLSYGPPFCIATNDSGVDASDNDWPPDAGN